MPDVALPDGRSIAFPDGMSPDKMAAAIREFLASEQRPAPPQAGATGDLMTDIPRFVGTAAVQAAAGGASLPRLAAQGVDWLGKRVGLDVGADEALGGIKHPLNPDYPMFPDYNTAKNAMMAGPGLSTGGTEYVPSSTAGRIGQSALASALMGGAGGLIGGGVRGAVSALPSSIGAGAGAQGGAEVAQATGLDPTVPALAGALLGGVAGNTVGQMAAGPRPALRPEVAQLAQSARDEFGIPITAGQVTENRFLRRVDSNLRNMPFTNYAENTEQTRTAFNRAVANTIGESADNLAPEVMNRARTRIGNVMNDVATKTNGIGDMDLVSKLGQIEQDATRALQANAGKVVGHIDDIVDRLARNGGRMTGEDYQSLTRFDRPLSHAIQSADPDVRFWARQVRQALDDALERSAPAEEVARLRQARAEWRNMKTVEDLAEKSPTGDINPRALLEQVRRNTNNMAYDGGGDLAQLGRIGKQFLQEPPDSGTPSRLMIQNPIGGDTAYAAAKNAISRLLLDPLASRALQSDFLTNRMIRSGTNPASVVMQQPHLLARALMAEIAANQNAARVSGPANTNR